ncbi:hypothetical protein WJX74_001920 [Apatococcus lobatus]|uniref:DNA polymerase delta subunit 4 n=2 Tax=Apatococcus TaxID=904362 RepID=A0AAW1SX53_9CHLO
MPQRLSNKFPQTKSSGPRPSKSTSKRQKIQDDVVPSITTPSKTNTLRSSQVHEDEDEECLRQFDLTSKFGPCTGMTRMERWTRAEEMGLSPPSSVKDILLRLDGGSSLQHDLWHDRV